MSKTRAATLRKPVLSGAEVLQFAEKSGRGKSAAANAAKGAKSGLVPTGDTRLTANIREDLHQKLKIRAVQERTTIGELIEQWVQSWGK